MSNQGARAMRRPVPARGLQAAGLAVYQYSGAVHIFAVCLCEEGVDASGRSSGGEQGRDGMAAQHDLVIPVYAYGRGGR